MRVLCFFITLSFISISASSQDTLYARSVIKKLTSKKFFGRGYTKNGLNIAADYLSGELKKCGVKPLFSDGYFQPLSFNVNTFPGKMNVKINGKKLHAGKDFIVGVESIGLKGKYTLQKKDSNVFVSENSEIPLIITIKKNLTYSAATRTAQACEIDILKGREPANINNADINIENEYIRDFKTKNICGYINGRQNNDTMIIFTAHYDHLGGMGKKIFFPGANDNASGVSMVMNFVKHYEKNPPKYKTVFVFFTGEEAGLIGSKYFVDNNTVDLKKIKFLINLDLLGTGDDGIMLVNGAVHTNQFELMNNINSEKVLVKQIKKRGKARNSDHYWFSEAGVPSFFIYTLGGTTSYHDVNDVAGKLPLTDYVDVFKLLSDFVSKL